MVNRIPKRVLQKIEYERYLLHVLSPGFYDEAASALVTHSEIHRLISMLNANRAPHNASRHACLFRELHRLLIKVRRVVTQFNLPCNAVIFDGISDDCSSAPTELRTPVTLLQVRPCPPSIA